MREGFPTESEIESCHARLRQLTCAELLVRVSAGEPGTILDVRTEPEWRGRHIPGAKLVPVQELRARLDEVMGLPGPLLVHCEHGMRSLDAALFLMWQGRDDVFNVREGLCAWTGLTEHGR